MSPALSNVEQVGHDESQPLGYVDLFALLEMTHQEYLDRFRGTAIRRAKHWMLQRNAAVALGNVGDESALPHLNEAMLSNEHPVVRGHAAWAIGRLGTRLRITDEAALQALNAALLVESDETVREEISMAIRDVQAVDEVIEGQATVEATSTLHTSETSS